MFVINYIYFIVPLALIFYSFVDRLVSVVAHKVYYHPEYFTVIDIIKHEDSYSDGSVKVVNEYVYDYLLTDGETNFRLEKSEKLNVGDTDLFYVHNTNADALPVDNLTKLDIISSIVGLSVFLFIIFLIGAAVTI